MSDDYADPESESRKSPVETKTKPGQAVRTWFGWRSKHRTINAQARLSKRLRSGEASPAASEWSSDHEEESRGSRGIEDL